MSEDEEKQVPFEHSSVGFPDSKIEHQMDRLWVFLLLLLFNWLVDQLFMCLVGWLVGWSVCCVTQAGL